LQLAAMTHDYSHVPPGHGMAGIQALGIEFTPRRGLSGVSPRATPLSKSASWRAIEDLNQRRVMDVDLLVSRRHLDSTHAQKTTVGAAGSLHSDRRRPDMPEALKYSSIEFQLRRCKSSPPTQFATPQNEIVQHIRANHQADQVGRKNSPRARSKSPSLFLRTHLEVHEEIISQAFSPRTPPPATRGGLKSKSPRRSTQQKPAVPKANSARGSNRTPRGELTITPPPRTPPGELTSSTSTEAFQQKLDMQSTMSTTASTQSILSPLAMTTADSSIMESIPGSARITDKANFCRMLDKRMAKLYEDQVHKIVQQQQKKAMKLVS